MNIIKKKAMDMMERKLSRTGHVLEVRAWDPATFFEIDLHLPGLNMEKWQSVQHMKIKVGDYVYRDYTPAMWDAETHTCTLLVNSSHDGPGSKWASSLKKGDTILYLGVGSTLHKPAENKPLLCLGDSSSIGHFLALQQLAKGKTEVYGAVSFNEARHMEAFKEYFITGLQPVLEKRWDISLLSWIDEQPLEDHCVYITGHIPTVTELRRYIRKRDDFSGTIKAQGFWA